MIDLHNLPSEDEAENIINATPYDDLLQLLNDYRERSLDDNIEQTEDEIRIGIMVVRRLRAMRETKTRVKKTTAKPKVEAFDSLDDLL